MTKSVVGIFFILVGVTGPLRSVKAQTLENLKGQPIVSDLQQVQLGEVISGAQDLKSRCAAEALIKKKVIHLSSRKKSTEEYLGDHWNNRMRAQIQSTEIGRRLLQKLPDGMPRNKVALTKSGVLAVDGSEPVLSSWLIINLIEGDTAKITEEVLALKNNPKQLVRYLENHPELEEKIVRFISPVIVHELTHRTQQFASRIYVAELEQEAFITEIRYALELLSRDIQAFGPRGQSNPFIFPKMRVYYTDVDQFLKEISEDYAVPELQMDHMPTIAERMKDPTYECHDFSDQKAHYDVFFRETRRAWIEERTNALAILSHFRKLIAK